MATKPKRRRSPTPTQQSNIVITDRLALARFADRPLAIAPRRLDALLAATSGDAASAIISSRERDTARGYMLTDAGIAVVPVIGPLVARHDWLSALFSATSYGELGDAIESAFADPSARAVLLELDSPGGEVGGLFDLVERLSTSSKESGKPLWAVASESALSAAHAIASTADRLYVTRTGEVGSVGVVAVHIDESAADAMAGLKWTLIHAGRYKVDGNPHQPLSAAAAADIQADVDALHAELVSLIARNRDLAPEAVRATEAAIFRGARGVDIGFADRVGTVAQALVDLASELDGSRIPSSAARRPNSSAPPRSTPMTTTDNAAVSAPAGPGTAPAATTPPSVSDPAPDPARQPNQPPAPAPAPPGSADTATDALRAEFAEIASIGAQAARLGVTVDTADALRKGIKPDALRRTVLDSLAARAEATSVVAAASTPAPPAESPIVRRARERAAAPRT